MSKEAMERRWPRVFLVLAFMGVLQMPPEKNVMFAVGVEVETENQPWDVEKIRALASEHYNCDFEVASEDMVEKLYGIWQEKEIAASSNRYQQSPANVEIFCEESFTMFGQPFFQPMYFCYTASIEELFAEGCLNIRWSDGRYANRTATFILAVGREGGETVPTDWSSWREIISIDGTLVMNKGGDFFEMKKMGDIHMWENFEELSPRERRERRNE